MSDQGTFVSSDIDPCLASDLINFRSRRIPFLFLEQLLCPLLTFANPKNRSTCVVFYGAGGYGRVVLERMFSA